MEKEDKISIRKLKAPEDYQVWKFQIDICLKAKDLFKLVDPGHTNTDTGSTSKSESKTATTSADYDVKDAQVQRLIIKNIDENLLIHIMDCTSGKDMYNKLKFLFQQTTAQQKVTLATELFAFKYEESKTAAENIARLTNISFRLKNIGQEVPPEMILAKILSSLPSKFESFRSAWDSTVETERTIENLVARLTALESMTQQETATPVAFKAQKNFNQKSNLRCHNCGKTGHFARDCRQQRQQKQQYTQQSHSSQQRQLHTPQSNFSQQSQQRFPPCRICHLKSHKEADCRYLDKRGSEDAKVAFMSRIDRDESWIVDSGASCHITNNSEILKDLKPSSISFNTANGGQMLTHTIGQVETDSCTLNDVAYVPDLSCNLFSVGKVTDKNGSVLFTKDKVIISKEGKEILTGSKASNGTYVLDLKTEESREALLASSDWHRKLGHLGKSNLKKLSKMSEGMNFSDENCDNCETCIKSSHSRDPFKSHLPEAKRPLEIVHTDVCGPIQTETHDNKKYFVTFLDDFTHYCQAALVSSKSEVAEVTKQFILEVENVQNVKVSKIKCDGGSEYLKLRNWAKSRGTILDVTPKYTPQNNGKAERLNKTLCNKMRALLYDSKLGYEFWGEALLTACYLTNRSPTKALSNATPHEAWTGQKPNLSKLQVFGSECYAKKLSYTKKLDPKSEKMIFIGYAPAGFRLWNQEKSRVEISRDVTFIPKIVQETVKLDECSSDSDTSDDSEYESDTPEVVQTVHLDEHETDSDHSDDTLENETGNETDTSDETPNTSPVSRRLRDPAARKKPERFGNYELDLTNVFRENSILLTYTEAVNGPEKARWQEAIDSEKRSLDEHKVWSYVDETKAKGQKVLNTTWVFRVKEDGKYKARLCVRGFEQKDESETYSPVVNTTSLRILFAIAASKKMSVQTFDVSTAYLYSKLEKDVFIRVPEGFPKRKRKILQLNSALYGLKSAPLCWWKTISTTLKQLGLVSLKTDPCVYKNAQNTVYLAIYVDDGLIVGDEKEIERVLRAIKNVYKITVCKNPQSYVGFEIHRNENGITLSQEKFVVETLKETNMQDANPVDTPIVKSQPSADDNIEIKFPYRSVVGNLTYLSSKTRPDIAFAVSYEGRSVEKPTSVAVQDVKRTLRYLKGHSTLGLSYPVDGDLRTLHVYSDSDYAEDIETRKSTSGYVLLYNGSPICWGSRRQPVVALSSTEAELIASCEALKHTLFVKNLLEELHSDKPAIVMHLDNTSTIALIRNGNYRRSKHIEVRFRMIAERFSEGIFDLKHCSTQDQCADILTKPLQRVAFVRLRSLLMAEHC